MTEAEKLKRRQELDRAYKEEERKRIADICSVTHKSHIPAQAKRVGEMYFCRDCGVGLGNAH